MNLKFESIPLSTAKIVKPMQRFTLLCLPVDIAQALPEAKLLPRGNRVRPNGDKNKRKLQVPVCESDNGLRDTNFQ